MNRPLPIDDLYTELHDDHYRHVHNWNDLDSKRMADRHQCSVDDVQEVMRQIEWEYPKRKRARR